MVDGGWKWSLVRKKTLADLPDYWGTKLKTSFKLKLHRNKHINMLEIIYLLIYDPFNNYTRNSRKQTFWLLETQNPGSTIFVIWRFQITGRVSFSYKWEKLFEWVWIRKIESPTQSKGKLLVLKRILHNIILLF